MLHRLFIIEEINECGTMNPNITRIQTFRSGQKGTVKPGRNGATVAQEPVLSRQRSSSVLYLFYSSF